MSEQMPDVRHGRPFWAVLVIAAIAQLMVILDTSIVNVALPAMKRGLDLSVAGQQWVVNAYILTFGGFLLLGGRIADHAGARRVFLAGLGIFTLASLLGGFAQDGGMLVGARVVQGIGAAILAPATLTLLTTTYTEAQHRTKALSVWALTAASGAAVGVVLGGVLTSSLSWRWVLFVNVPIGAALFAASARYLPPGHGTARGWNDLDLPGSLAITSGLALLIYGIVSTGTYAWGSAHTLAFLVAGAALTGAFILIEARSSRPLVPLRIFRARSIRASTLIAVLVGVVATSFFFFLSLYLQQVNHYSAVRGGLALLPAAAATATASVLSGRLVKRTGPRVLLITGSLLAAAGILWMSQVSAGDSYASHVLVPSILTMFGIGMCFVPMAVLATEGVPMTDAGLASGLLNAGRQVGGAVGLAALVTVAATRTRSYAGSHRAATDIAAKALAAGYDLGFAIAGIIFLLVIAVALALLPRRPAGPPIPDETEEEIIGVAIAEENI
jgi:EmrB/QacA subfamily drug resistance transporter